MLIFIYFLIYFSDFVKTQGPLTFCETYFSEFGETTSNN